MIVSPFLFSGIVFSYIDILLRINAPGSQPTTALQTGDLPLEVIGG